MRQMKNIKSIVIGGLSLLGGLSSQAQDFGSFYSYMLNPFNINSAYSGDGDRIVANLNSRSQFTGVEGAPSNIMFGLHAPVFTDQGVGLKMISDTRGVFEVTRIDGMYSQRFNIDEETSIRFGLSVGLLNRSLDASNISGDAQQQVLADPTLSSGAFNSTHFVAGFGVLGNWKSLEIGMSAPHVIENASGFNQHLVFSLGYDYAIENTKWTVKPWAMYQNLPVTTNIFDVAVKGTWNDKVMTQLAYANNNRLKMALGFDLKGFGVAYMYEQQFGELKSLSNGAHEIMVTISIGRKTKRLGVTQLENDLDAMLEYIKSLQETDANHGKAFIISEVKKLHEQLNVLLDENTEKNAGKVSEKLIQIEEQIDLLIEKYKGN